MEYDRGESFPLDFEPNEIVFSSKSKRKLSPRSYSTQFERKWESINLSWNKYDEVEVLISFPCSLSNVE